MTTDARLAASLAETAGELLLGIRSSDDGGDPKALGKRGDSRSNTLILDHLAAERPGDAVLSEESADDPARLSAERVWIIDPLDGTREFSMPGRDDWAVHVALWQAGAGITDAAVTLPARGEVHVTDAPATNAPATNAPATNAPAARSEAAAEPEPDRTRIVLVSDSRPPAFAPDVAAAIGGQVAPMGSAGAKAMAVLRGDAVAYVHAGGQWEWDSAAPVGVLLAAGYHASRIDGRPLEYNQAHPYLPDLLICRADLAAPLLGALAAYL